MASASSGGMPRLRVPPAASDTHIHVYDAKYPIAPTAIGKPPEASAEAYRVVMQRLGMERAVIVQPSAYGTDNRCTLAGMATLGLQQTRGIAVVDDKVTEGALESLTAGGMRGARLHMLPGGAIPWQMADAVAARVQAVGWHVQLQLVRCLLRLVDSGRVWVKLSAPYEVSKAGPPL
jgi:D-galactarolactone isomerase